ncbi:MAG: TonB family protein [Methylomonas sp.]|jgi:protein TonB
MTQTQTPKLKSFALSSGDTLLLAVFLAALIHIAILLGIGFNKPQESIKAKKTVDVSLLKIPAKKPPKNAKTLAADNQLGGGDTLIKTKSASENLQAATNKADSPTETADREIRQEQKKTQQKKILTQSEAPVKAPTPLPEVEAADAEESKPKLSTDDLQQQIVKLGERIRDSQQLAEDSKIKYANSVSAHKYLAAQYVKDWEEKVERTGNLNYPDVAKNIGESQTLTMNVGINSDGSIYSMRIVKSSGNPALDEAAKRIVKMSAPFAELPSELLQEVNVLVITRVWKFSDETGMTTR